MPPSTAQLKMLNEVAVSGRNLPDPPGLYMLEGIMVVESSKFRPYFRVFDWNRLDGQGQNRPCMWKALQVIDFGKAPPRGFSPEEVDDGFSLENEDFTLLYRRVTGENNMSQSPEAFTILTVVGGEGELRHQGRVYPLRYGDSYLLPACLGRYTLCGELKLLFGSANRPLNIP